MTDIFSSPKQMLRRAKHHVEDLKAKIDSFVKEKPWSHVVEKDTDGITNLHKVKFTGRLSEDIPGALFDAANNLRSVLDQIAFAIAVKHTGSANPKSAKFPFGPTEADMVNNAKGGCKDLPPEIVSVFKSFKPYKGGNDALWGLNKLANTPKHQTIVPVAVGGFFTSFNFSGSEVQNMTILRPQWNALNNEILFLRDGSGTQQFTYNANVAFTITLSDVDEVICGQDPVRVFQAMAGEVENILAATEAECVRLGLVDAI